MSTKDGNERKNNVEGGREFCGRGYVPQVVDNFLLHTFVWCSPSPRQHLLNFSLFSQSQMKQFSEAERLADIHSKLPVSQHSTLAVLSCCGRCVLPALLSDS